MSQLDKAAQRHKVPSIPVSVIAPSRKKQAKNKQTKQSFNSEQEYAEK